MVLSIWESNRFLEIQIKTFTQKIHPLIIHFLLSLIVVGVISVLFAWLFPLISGTPLSLGITSKLALGFAFRVNLFLHCINAIVFFMDQSRQNQIENESLLKETAEARFAALRNQVNPHFLFNSFNVLSALIYKDSDTASHFVEQLSKVYRYLLSNQNNKVVHIQSELEFLHAYIYLLEIRFGQSLFIDNQVKNQNLDFYIAPATLQMLIENAIKHNVISKANPLSIKVYVESRYIVIANSIQLKEVKEESTGTGLDNIRQRYQFLSAGDSIIIESNGQFIVKIPKLMIEDEDINR
jgi:LytS/YehU family sensor histidine kinase